MANKCDNCKKGITKSSPGLECSRCERMVHLATKCTGLSAKQIAALKAASPSLEWVCLECRDECPRRSSSIIVPENDEDDEDVAPVEVNTKKFLVDVTKEVEKAIRKEMREIHDCLQFQSAKMDEVVESLDLLKRNMKELERKNTALTNKNVNLELRVGTLEQRIQEFEQEKLCKYIEIANIPIETPEESKQVVENIAKRLNLPKEGIKSTRKIQVRKDQPAKIIVELLDEHTQVQWTGVAKNGRMTVADVHPTEKHIHNPVYIRESMTKLNKQLFWNTKQELKIKQQFKYVWFKRGYVRARKDDNEKTYTIRNMQDLESLVNKNKVSNPPLASS